MPTIKREVDNMWVWQDIRSLILIFFIGKGEVMIDEGIDILKSRENF